MGVIPAKLGLLVSVGLLLPAASPLGAQEKTADEREWEAHLTGLPEEMATFFTKVVMPKLVEAGSNDRVFDEAVQAYTHWLRQLVIKGIDLDAPSVERAQAALGKAYRNAILARSKYCFEQKDPSEVVIMQGLLSAADAMAVQTDVTSEMLDELMAKCLRFELIFTSDIRVVTEGYTQRSAVQATVPLVVVTNPKEGMLPLLRGSGPLDYVSFDLQLRHPPGRCPGITTSTEPAEATVYKLQYKMERDSAKVPARFSEVELWLHPGKPTETLTICYPEEPQTYWFTAFQLLHLAEQSADADKAFFIFKDWKVSGAGEVFARKEVTEPSDSARGAASLRKVFSGAMRLELRHKPIWP